MQNANALTIAEPDRAGQARVLSVSTSQQPGSRTGYIGVAEAIRIIRRRRWLILLVVLFALLATAVFLARATPVYTATTVVLVPPLDPASGGTPPASTAAPTQTPSPSEEADIQTKVELLQSRALVQQTAHSLQLDKDPEFAPGPGGPGLMDRLFNWLSPPPPTPLDPRQAAEAAERARNETITDNLVSHINVTRVARSNVISITASSVDPAKSARIANRLVDTYIHDQIDEAAQTRSAQIASLTSRVAEVRGYLQSADVTATNYRRQHGLLNATPEDNGSAQTSQLGALLAQAQAESAADARKNTPTEMPDGGISASSMLLTQLRQQQAELSRKLSELTSFYGPGYPEVVKSKAEMTALQARIDQETARLSADLGSQAAASQARTATIGSAIAGLRSQSFSQGQSAVPLRALDRTVDAANTLYTTLLNQLNAKIGSAPEADPDITRISRAPIPDTPSYPLPKRVLGVMALASLAMGTLLAFAIETMDTKLRTAEQVQRLLGIPTLAMVPEIDEEYGPIHGAITGRPRSRFAEAVRNLLIEVESRTPASNGSRVVVVTSPLEGEGKNTVATSLAAAATAIGRHTVIVDFDLRRPGIDGEDLPPSGSAGVVAYLTERAMVEDLVTAEKQGRFAIIGVGEIAADPGALIASARLPQLLDQLRDRFELVILNAPPILPVRDAKTLADHADAALLVLRWGRTSPEAAAAALDLFNRPITGAVMNRVDYAVHANRRYGDAIHHVAASNAYYDAEPLPGHRSPITRMKRWFRRAIGRTAEALHLA